MKSWLTLLPNIQLQSLRAIIRTAQQRHMRCLTRLNHGHILQGIGGQSIDPSLQLRRISTPRSANHVKCVLMECEESPPSSGGIGLLSKNVQLIDETSSRSKCFGFVNFSAAEPFECVPSKIIDKSAVFGAVGVVS